MVLRCQTVAGAFESQFQLRSFTLMGTVIVAVWCLSPLGSQASLRSLGKTYNTTTDYTQLLYLPTAIMSNAQVNNNALASGDAGAEVNAATTLYNGALLSYSSISEPADQWRNVKIPWLEDLTVNLPILRRMRFAG